MVERIEKLEAEVERIKTDVHRQKEPTNAGGKTAAEVALDNAGRVAAEQMQARIVAFLRRQASADGGLRECGHFAEADAYEQAADLIEDGEHMSDLPTDPLHPGGRCTCAGEGRCEWCRTTCLWCGAPHLDVGHPVDRASCARCLAEALTAAERRGLERAAQAMCRACDDGDVPRLSEDGIWFHYDFPVQDAVRYCDAGRIRALIDQRER